jgi:hypothetical protein
MIYSGLKIKDSAENRREIEKIESLTNNLWRTQDEDRHYTPIKKI